MLPSQRIITNIPAIFYKAAISFYLHWRTVFLRHEYHRAFPEHFTAQISKVRVKFSSQLEFSGKIEMYKLPRITQIFNKLKLWGKSLREVLKYAEFQQHSCNLRIKYYTSP
jgi:hypothetical protein